MVLRCRRVCLAKLLCTTEMNDFDSGKRLKVAAYAARQRIGDREE